MVIALKKMWWGHYHITRKGNTILFLICSSYLLLCKSQCKLKNQIILIYCEFLKILKSWYLENIYWDWWEIIVKVWH